MLFVPKWLLSADASRSSGANDDEVEQLSLSERLEYYKAHAERPPSSRIDPLLEQRVHNAPLSLVNLWKYGAFLATKATDIASDLLRHQLIGARKKSWGLEMTILSAFMRNIGHHSTLADLRTLRSLLALGTALSPVVPGDALVTPVTFTAKRRGLRGFLADVDAREDGRRVIGGEWVVCRDLWLRLQAQWRRAKKSEKQRTSTSASTSARGSPSVPSSSTQSRVILFLHGGAYYMFSPATHRTVTIPLSKHTESRVFAVDYRLAPETRFPGQLHDAVLAYLRLVEDLNIPPGNITVCGDSAGGGLALALLLYLRDNAYPLPNSCILMSPWVDLTMSCDSWDSNAEFDLVPTPKSGDHLNPILCLLGPTGLSNQYLTHPYASPLFGQMQGLPPLLIQSGDAEVLRDEAMLLAHKATLAGVKVRHEIYEDQVHVFQMFFFLDAAKKALIACNEFLQSLADDPSLSRPKRAISSGSLSFKEKGGVGKPSDIIIGSDATPTPEGMPKEVEARLERELVGSGSRVMLVRGDGTVVDEDPTAPGHEADSNAVTPPEYDAPQAATKDKLRSGSGSVGTKGRQNPQLRDGTTVDTWPTEDTWDGEEPDSPISFKPRRRSPGIASSEATPPTVSRTPSTASITGIRPKSPIPVPTVRRRTSGYFANSPNSPSTSPTKGYGMRPRSGSASSQYYNPVHHGTLNRSNSGVIVGPPPSTSNTSMSARHLSKRRTQMSLSLTTSSPYNVAPSVYPLNQAIGSGLTTPAAMNIHGTPLLSPSIPSIRKRERATSHPDVFKLCQSWAELGPANDLVVIEANPSSDHE
ncbi:hypothetical protein M408DRAFT_235905 [Serendipita vermifera MAFF 305830]|uniref:Alpha/beta hydrolase fold-3 domain-containing protein n=1 Tax=Serendipita vermifera MAFF 305830 TaxID=933852 RepID=A0A0C2XRW4_SERVB|nr:hypothetical protein M408DRAFT_235905 [Serendipita vermifera MAFF 305830]